MVLVSCRNKEDKKTENEEMIFGTKSHTVELIIDFKEILKNDEEIIDTNIVKVIVDQELENNSFLDAKDFFRIKKDLKNEKIYHHIGIYAFTIDALTKYVKLSRSKFEIERGLEQLRAMENNLVIKVGLSDSAPLGVDTKEDLKKITKEMN